MNVPGDEQASTADAADDHVGTPSENDAEAVLIIDQEDLDYVYAVAEQNSVAVERVQQQGLAELLTVTLIIFGASLAVAAVAHLVDQRKGGQVFDMRENAPRQAYRSKDVVYGLVQIIAADGTVTVEVKEPRGMFGQVIDGIQQSLVGLAGAPAREVEAKVSLAVGPGARVTS